MRSATDVLRDEHRAVLGGLTAFDDAAQTGLLRDFARADAAAHSAPLCGAESAAASLAAALSA